MAVEILRDQLSSLRDLHDRNAADKVMNALRGANLAIYNRTVTETDKQGMGTTASVLIIAGRRYLIGQVGDSRIYLMREGALRQLTKDLAAAATERPKSVEKNSAGQWVPVVSVERWWARATETDTWGPHSSEHGMRAPVPVGPHVGAGDRWWAARETSSGGPKMSFRSPGGVHSLFFFCCCFLFILKSKLWFSNFVTNLYSTV